jgi:DNA-binding HxlR family transcriptional regulator
MLRLTVNSYEDARDCPFRAVLDHVGDKWTFLILVVLEDGPKRFGAIKRTLGDISQRVLTRKLRDLERDGYVSREVFPERPPRVEYALTDLGRSMLDPIRRFLDWTLTAFPEVKRAREEFDRRAENDVVNAQLPASTARLSSQRPK